MSRRLRIPLLLAFAAALAAGCGSGGKARPAEVGAGAGQARVWKPGTPDTLGPTVAIVGTRRVRAHEVDSLIATAPANVQPQLREKEGYKNLVERIVTEEVVFQAARRSNLEQDPAYRAALARAARDILMRTYYERAITSLPAPSDSTVQAYYDAHAAEFEVPARTRVRHIQVATRAKAEALRKRLLGGALWDALCRANSTDKLTKEQGGVLGFVTPVNDFVPVIGKAPAIVAAAFALKEGETSRPLKSDKGWHLIRVDSGEPKRTQPLSEARARIVGQLTSDRQEAYSKTFLDSLRTAAGATVFDDSIAVALIPARTPQDYFKEAQAAVSPQLRIQLYRALVTRYPNDPVSMQARFMIGFTYAEDLGEYDLARDEFEKFIGDYPNSELANSARWMLENMDKPAPELKDSLGGPGRTGAPPDTTR